MTDATKTQTDDAVTRTLSDQMSGSVRDILARLRDMGARIAEMRATMREQRDFDRIHNALASLNNRQLAMLGLERDDIYTFAELCVHEPARRPVIRLYDAGPALALPDATPAFPQIEDTSGETKGEQETVAAIEAGEADDDASKTLEQTETIRDAPKAEAVAQSRREPDMDEEHDTLVVTGEDGKPMSLVVPREPVAADGRLGAVAA